MRFLSEEQFMVGLANSRVALLIDPTSAFPAESDEIERTAKRRTLSLDAYDSNGCTSGQYLDDLFRRASVPKMRIRAISM